MPIADYLAVEMVVLYGLFGIVYVWARRYVKRDWK